MLVYVGVKLSTVLWVKKKSLSASLWPRRKEKMDFPHLWRRPQVNSFFVRKDVSAVLLHPLQEKSSYGLTYSNDRMILNLNWNEVPKF